MHDLEQRQAALAVRLRKGEPSALAELFDLNRERLLRLVRFRMDRRLSSRVDPDDVLQEAYLAASSRIDHFLGNPSASIFLWLRWIVSQTLVDVHRRHVGAEMRNAGLDVSMNAAPAGQSTSVCLAHELSGSVTSPSQFAMRAERYAQLERAIAGLSEIDQEVIALRHFEELSNLETAEVLNLTPTAASNRYIRAVSRLKDVLAEFPDFTGY